jgi:hypothetical protein
MLGCNIYPKKLYRSRKIEKKYGKIGKIIALKNLSI